MEKDEVFRLGMKTSQNPFVYNAPVRGEDFFNREETIKTILTQTATGKSQGTVWVVGERQVGKTSLLRYLQSYYKDSPEKIELYGIAEPFTVAFIYTNCQDFKTRSEFYGSLHQSLKNFFDFKIEYHDNAYKNFNAAIQYVHSQKYYPIFLLDEFDALIQNMAWIDPSDAGSFLAALNKLILGISELINEEKAFSCIFAANCTMEELINNLKIPGSCLSCERIELSWFSAEEVALLATQYLSDNSDLFSKEEIEFCYERTQGYPYFTQKLLSLMHEEKSKNPNNYTEYLAKVENDFGQDIATKIKDWGGDQMPRRTVKKIYEFLSKVSKYFGPKAIYLVDLAIKFKNLTGGK
jgi:hypothetical protein